MKSAAPELLPLLKQYFGFTSFRPLQKEIIRDSFAGKEIFARLPTGGSNISGVRKSQGNKFDYDLFRIYRALKTRN